jgi:hypothetical protein
MAGGLSFLLTRELCNSGEESDEKRCRRARRQVRTRDRAPWFSRGMQLPRCGGQVRTCANLKVSLPAWHKLSKEPPRAPLIYVGFVVLQALECPQPTLLKQRCQILPQPQPVRFETLFLCHQPSLRHARRQRGPDVQRLRGSGLAGAASAERDVPGEREDINAIGSRVAFDVLREAGSNLMHEFWPDVRRKFFHR